MYMYVSKQKPEQREVGVQAGGEGGGSAERQLAERERLIGGWAGEGGGGRVEGGGGLRVDEGDEKRTADSFRPNCSADESS